MISDLSHARCLNYEVGLVCGKLGESRYFSYVFEQLVYSRSTKIKATAVPESIPELLTHRVFNLSYVDIDGTTVDLGEEGPKLD